MEETGRTRPLSAVDDHQQEAAAEEQAARLDQLPDLGQDLFQLGLGAAGGEVG